MAATDIERARLARAGGRLAAMLLADVDRLAAALKAHYWQDTEDERETVEEIRSTLDEIAKHLDAVQAQLAPAPRKKDDQEGEPPKPRRSRKKRDAVTSPLTATEEAALEEGARAAVEAVLAPAQRTFFDPDDDPAGGA